MGLFDAAPAPADDNDDDVCTHTLGHWASLQKIESIFKGVILGGDNNSHEMSCARSTQTISLHGIL